MRTRIAGIRAMEILDSRGNPTLRVVVTLRDGQSAAASVPSGASTGRHEAVELRDGDLMRYAGMGVTRAIAHVERTIAAGIVGLDAVDQSRIDRTMLEIDGTPSKATLGANAILGVSMACCRAAACVREVPLYAHLGGLAAVRVPMPMINVINGGKHADSGLDFQEFMIVPVGYTTFREALRASAETFHALKAILRDRGFATSVGDEGGFAPRLASNEDACRLIVEAIKATGRKPGSDIALALDPAATSFAEHGHYRLSRDGRERSSAEMTALYESLIGEFPIISIEDGLAEDDWEGFAEQTALLGTRVQIVGDDILVTNPRFIERAVRERTCNAALIKLNQIGTVTETIEAVESCRHANWGYVISHRSGETDDAFIADFAVAMGGGQIKAGSVSRGERVAKYNRLLEIERELGNSARFGPIPRHGGA